MVELMAPKWAAWLDKQLAAHSVGWWGFQKVDCWIAWWVYWTAVLWAACSDYRWAGCSVDSMVL